ncbi:hypothetical protein BD779DRAFT_1610249 [Infundibulicybe gibba]|nr:hypothetical protein BD779DRAFT_1610249 [Infundibulicybe gibba]
MVHFSTALLVFAISTGVNGAPLAKRIAQVISASTTQWEKACDAAGGGQQCNQLSVAAFSTLLAAPGPCEQQNAADNMIDLAKTLNNSANMIALTQVFAQQPRNTPTSLSVPYCQQAPRNAELNGLFQCQFAGANPKTFVGGIAVGQPGTIPFGATSPLSPPGSCPANPSGPIADGTQLVDATQNPGVAGGAPKQNNGANTQSSAPAIQPPSQTAAPLPASSPSASPAPKAAPSGNFQLQNGKDAQQLNAQFASLTANSPCNDGDEACIGTSFAQCVGGKFVLQPCSSPLTCAALPLVNKPGTSIACTTQADWWTGGTAAGSPITSNASSTMAPPQAKANVAAAPPAAIQNGKDAQALNAKFASLTVDSACSDDELACIGTGFAQCVGGKFVVRPCGVSLTCAALPLVNSRGTSVTCATEADAVARIQATGATGA